MSGCCNNCFCCGCYLVPRYKRLVNNLFPPNPQNGLDKDNLERLRFYAVQKPEKLDKSFRYMSEKVARYLRHRNKPYVILGITAMNDTIKACYQQLNTFVDHYLDALRLVLEEKNDLELTEKAVSSFEYFCEIKEEAPNYQRNYDFFVERFTELCHNSSEINRTKFRCLGLRGHHALIKKTANDELLTDVWKHMEKIVPSIIFNMEVQDEPQRISTRTSREQSPTSTAPEQIELIERVPSVNNESPSFLAENVLRDLFCRAHLSNIPVCVQPIFTHLDNHQKWTPVDFPKYIFAVIMNSIKHHNSYLIIELFLGHLEKHFEREESSSIKTSIMNVIQDCMVFAAANTGAGSTMFDGLSRFLKILRRSFQLNSTQSRTNNENAGGEETFQLAVIDGINNFAEKLPDFQMMEVMQVIVSSLAALNQEYEKGIDKFADANLRLQLSLLQTVKKLAATYRTVHRRESSTQTTYPHQLFDPLLKMMSVPQPDVRLLVLEILQLLIDRQRYAEKLNQIKLAKDISQLDLPNENKASRLFDIAFMKKYGRHFLGQLYQTILMENNNKQIFQAIYSLLNLVTLDAPDKDVFVDVVHFCLGIQSILDPEENGSAEIRRILSPHKQFCIHALIAAFFNLISKFNGILPFSNHVDQIVHLRESRAPYLLPNQAFYSNHQERTAQRPPNECFFSREILIQALNDSGYDISRFEQQPLLAQESEPEPGEPSNDSETEGSIISEPENSQMLISVNPSLSVGDVILLLSPLQKNNSNQETNRTLIEDFRTKPFPELKKIVDRKQKIADQRIEQILDVFQLSKDSTQNRNGAVSPTVKQTFNYPELFTY